MVKEFLSRHGVPYVEKDVSQDRMAAVEMIRHTQQQGVPVTKIDGQYVVGFDRPRLETILRARATAGAGATERPSLGIAVADAARHAAPGSPPGAYVGQVKPGSPGAQAGVQVGDIIIRLAGHDVHNASDVTRILASLRTGQAFEGKVYRNGTERPLSFRL